MKNKRIIVFHPDINVHKTRNEYTHKVYSILEEKYDVRSLEWFIAHPFNKDIVCIYLNWYENTIGKDVFLIQKLQYSIKYAILCFAHIRRIKIIYVIHNKTPHNLLVTSELYQNIVKKFMEKSLNLVDIIIELCEHTTVYLENGFRIRNLRNKIRFIPHGKYTKYDCGIEKYLSKYGIKRDELLFCFIGQMDKYKNIDLIIEAFYESCVKAKLLLVGKCLNDYKDYLESIIKDNSIIRDYTFVSDEDMSGIMQAAHAIILPYENTSINSGIMINAFSNGTTVIGTNIEMLQDYPQNLVYSYSYGNRKEHIQALSNAIRLAEDDFQKGAIKEKGNRLESIMNEKNTWEDIKLKLLSIIDNLEAG